MINICLLGDSAVGKTTFFQTYKNNEYTPSETATIGITKYTVNKGDVTINITDTAGEEKYDSLPEQYVKKSNYFMVFFDPNGKNPSQNVKDWCDKVNKAKGVENVEKIVKVGINKTDVNITDVNGISGEDVVYVNGLKNGNLDDLKNAFNKIIIHFNSNKSVESMSNIDENKKQIDEISINSRKKSCC